MSYIHPSAKIHPTAIVYDNVTIGKNTTIGAYAIIGGCPEHREYFNKPYKGVVIGDNCWIGEAVTIHAGTTQNTVIGHNVVLLTKCQIGHDAFISNGCTVSCLACVCGHCVIEENTNIAVSAVIHQKVTVPSGCMIGMGAIVTKKTEMQPNSKYVGNPARYLAPNVKP